MYTYKIAQIMSVLNILTKSSYFVSKRRTQGTHYLYTLVVMDGWIDTRTV